MEQEAIYYWDGLVYVSNKWLRSTSRPYHTKDLRLVELKTVSVQKQIRLTFGLGVVWAAIALACMWLVPRPLDMSESAFDFSSWLYSMVRRGWILLFLA